MGNIYELSDVGEATGLVCEMNKEIRKQKWLAVVHV